MNIINLKKVITLIMVFGLVGILITSCEKEKNLNLEMLENNFENEDYQKTDEVKSNAYYEEILKWEEEIQNMVILNPNVKNSVKNRASKMMCNCELILQADIATPRGGMPNSITAFDLFILNTIILDFDYDGDGCVSMLNNSGGFSDDVLGWINAGFPTNQDYIQDGNLGWTDGRRAFEIANLLGGITGGPELCWEDIMCVQQYILGIIEC